MIVTIFDARACVCVSSSSLSSHTKAWNGRICRRLGRCVMVACTMRILANYYNARVVRKFVSLCVMRSHCFTMIILMSNGPCAVCVWVCVCVCPVSRYSHNLYVSSLKANCMIWSECVCSVHEREKDKWRHKEWTKTTTTSAKLCLLSFRYARSIL